MSKKLLKLLGYILILVGMYAVSESTRDWNHNKLRQDMKYTTAEIKRCAGQGAKSRRTTVYFSFEIPRGAYEGTGSYSILPNARNELVGRKCPVVYQDGDPDNNHLLLTESDFEMFGQKYPDSMQWVAQYLN